MQKIVRLLLFALEHGVHTFFAINLPKKNVMFCYPGFPNYDNNNNNNIYLTAIGFSPGGSRF